MDFIVPVAVEHIRLQTDPSEFLVGHLGSGRIAVGIEFGMDLQPFGSGGGGDEIDDDLEADQRLATPVLADETEQPMLDLVPLARARWKVTDGDPQPRFIR